MRPLGVTLVAELTLLCSLVFAAVFTPALILTATVTQRHDIVFKTNSIPSQEQLLNAANYIKSRYDERVGLVTESEDPGQRVRDAVACNRTFWIYSDNLWAAQALRPFYQDTAENISKSMMPYIATYSDSGLYEVVLGTKIPTPVHSNNAVNVANLTLDDLSYSVWVNRHKPEDGKPFFDAERYADLAFYLSLNYHLEHDTIASEKWFRIGEAMWNGYGFLDRPANESERFDNYKLGLYLLTFKVTGVTSAIYERVENMAWSCQKGNGGIAAKSYFNGSLDGTANIETTSAILLAYNKDLIESMVQTRVGAYYYAWWGIPFNNHWTENIKGTPLIGKYDSNDSSAADQHILLAKQHKIDFFAVSWFGKGDWLDWDFDDIDQNLRSGLLSAPHLSSFSFCLFYETELVLKGAAGGDKNFTEIFINDMVYAAQHYFVNPNYLRVGGNPALFLYNLPYVYQNLTGSGVHRLLDTTRQRLESMGVNVYFVGDAGSGPSPNQAVSQNWTYSMNATTSYLFSSPSEGWERILEDAEDQYPNWRSAMNSAGVKFVPSAYPGYNDTGNDGATQPVELPPNEIMFNEFVRISKRNVDNDLGIIMITSWNEWKEATTIEPSNESARAR
jgi:hypothetical protein